MVYKTEAIIIKRKNLSGTDRLLTLYTQDFGKIIVKAKSVRKNQAKLKSYLELFNYSYLMIAQGRNLDVVTSAEPLNNFSYLKQDLSNLIVAYYLSDLIDKLVVGTEHDSLIWQLLKSSFSQLNRGQSKFDLRNLVNNFEKKMLQYLGYGLSEETKPENLFNQIQDVLEEKINSRKFLDLALKKN